MGFILPILAWVGTGITTAAVMVGTAVVSVVTAVIGAVVTIATSVASFMAGAVAGIVSGLGLVSGLGAANALQSIGLLNAISVSTFATIGGAVSAVTTAFKTFLDAIHFKTLMQIHKIAMLVSKDYRNMIQNVYGEISRYAEAVHLEPEYFLLALENTRSIVLDVSSVLGRKYDLGQVAWLQELKGWAENVQDIGSRYKGNPEQVLEDLSQWITKPAMDSKATVFQNLFGAVESTIDLTEVIVNDVTKVRDDLEKLTHDLPESIRKRVEPEIRKITGKVDDFIRDEYKPVIKELRKITDTITGTLDNQRGDLKDLIERLKRPGDYLSEIDGLPDDVRRDQEIKIGDLSTRVYEPYGNEINRAAAPINMELRRIGEALSRKLEVVEWYAKEIKVPEKRDIEDIDDTKTWFVGDY